jgi:hypothetical protein
MEIKWNARYGALEDVVKVESLKMSVSDRLVRITTLTDRMNRETLQDNQIVGNKESMTRALVNV